MWFDHESQCQRLKDEKFDALIWINQVAEMSDSDITKIRVFAYVFV